MALDLTPVIGQLPYRIALAGGWIDQPFVSRLCPGSMVVASLEPTVRFMERSGFATGTRNVARKLWGDRLPAGDPWKLMTSLYEAENADLREPSGSQDMAGLLFPGVSRLDYDGGVFPSHIESCVDAEVASWLEKVLFVLPVEPRPSGYSPLGEKHLDPGVVRELGASGKECYRAILSQDLDALGETFNRCMACWGSLFPHVLRHPTLKVDLASLLQRYREAYPGAMYSGCGGGYLIVASDEPVPGGFRLKVRLS